MALGCLRSVWERTGHGPCGRWGPFAPAALPLVGSSAETQLVHTQAGSAWEGERERVTWLWHTNAHQHD